MTNAFTFEVLGRPRPKERPRVADGRAYTPRATKLYERTVRDAAWVAMARERLHAPGAWSRSGRFALVVEIVPEDRRHGDGSNILKAVEDALNGLVYEDDRQVVDGRFVVREPEKQNPRIIVEVSRCPVPNEKRPSGESSAPSTSASRATTRGETSRTAPPQSRRPCLRAGTKPSSGTPSDSPR